MSFITPIFITLIVWTLWMHAHPGGRGGGYGGDRTHGDPPHGGEHRGA